MQRFALWRALVAAVALALLAAACSSDDEGVDTGGGGDATTTTAQAAETTQSTAAATTESTAGDDDASDTTEATVADGPIAYAGTGGTATAGPLTLTAEQCVFAAGDLLGVDAPDHFSSVAPSGDAVFLAGQDGEAGTGLLKFTVATDGGCVLTPDASFGSGGALAFDDEIDFVSGGGSGVVAASNSIFGTWMVDAATGDAAECDDGDYTDLSPDGSVAYGHFPGSGELNRYDVGGGTCTVTDAAVVLSEQDNLLMGGWITDQLYVVGGFLPEGGAGVTAIDRSGNELWTVGGSPGDIGDEGYGTVSAVSPCSGYVCVVDSNFRELHILEPADGTLIALVDLQDLVGLSINWFNGMAEDDAGNLWLTGGLAQLDADGERTETVQGLVYRIVVS